METHAFPPVVPDRAEEDGISIVKTGNNLKLESRVGKTFLLKLGDKHHHENWGTTSCLTYYRFVKTLHLM